MLRSTSVAGQSSWGVPTLKIGRTNSPQDEHSRQNQQEPDELPDLAIGCSSSVFYLVQKMKFESHYHRWKVPVTTATIQMTK